MPRFSEAFPEMSRVLARIPARADFDLDEAEPWTRLVRALLLGVDARKRERAIEALRDEGLLAAESLADAELVEVTELLRLQNASIPERALIPLKRVAEWLVKRHDGRLDSLSSIDSDTLREQLLAIKGVGLSLADSLLLFGLGRGVARFDRPTFRVLVRHGWLDPSSEPAELYDLLENALDRDPNSLADWSIKLDAVARDYCRVARPHCERCPLRPFLPDSGPICADEESS